MQQERRRSIDLDEDKANRIRTAESVRNHRLFSKAERVLTITGWSEQTRSDLEIYRLVDTEGLTPLLEVLNELTMAMSREAAAQNKQDA